MTEQQSEQNPLMIIVVLQLVILAIAMVGIRWADLDLPVDSKNVVSNVAIGSIAGILSYAALLLFARADTPISKELREESAKVRGTIASWGYFSIFIAAILPAIGEEALFRVLIQGWVGEATMTSMGILVGALLFGAAHMVSKTYFVLTFVLGLAIGVGYAVRQDIVLIFTWHLVYNLISFSVLCKRPQLLRIPNQQEPAIEQGAE